MSLNVGYFLRANSDIYGVIASYLPPRAILVTLGTREPEEEIERARDLDFLIAVHCTGDMIRGAPRLRLIQLPGVGYDQADLKAARQLAFRWRSVFTDRRTQWRNTQFY